MLANGVCNIMERKNGGAVLCFFLTKYIISEQISCASVAIALVIKTHRDYNTALFKFNSAKIKGVK